jgi:flagellar basal body-associated protein FliL
MTESMVFALIPIVSVLAVFGLPVAIVFMVKYFKLKERELAMEVDTRHKSQQQQLAMEERVRHLEDVLLNLDHDVRARLGIGQPGAPLASRPDLLEAPPEAGEQGSTGTGPIREKSR